MELGVRLVGVSAVAAVIVMMLWIGHLFFDKDTKVSVLLLIIEVTGYWFHNRRDGL